MTDSLADHLREHRRDHYDRIKPDFLVLSNAEIDAVVRESLEWRRWWRERTEGMATR